MRLIEIQYYYFKKSNINILPGKNVKGKVVDLLLAKEEFAVLDAPIWNKFWFIVETAGNELGKFEWKLNKGLASLEFEVVVFEPNTKRLLEAVDAIAIVDVDGVDFSTFSVPKTFLDKVLTLVLTGDGILKIDSVVKTVVGFETSVFWEPNVNRFEVEHVVDEEAEEAGWGKIMLFFESVFSEDPILILEEGRDTCETKLNLEPNGDVVAVVTGEIKEGVENGNKDDEVVMVTVVEARGNIKLW